MIKSNILPSKYRQIVTLGVDLRNSKKKTAADLAHEMLAPQFLLLAVSVLGAGVGNPLALGDTRRDNAGPLVPQRQLE